MYFGWLAREGERTSPNPMCRGDRPKVTKKARQFFDDEELVALLKTCQGATFADRWDTPILRIFMDTGMRVSGLAGLRYDQDDSNRNDVFLSQRRLRLRLKGGDETRSAGKPRRPSTATYAPAPGTPTPHRHGPGWVSRNTTSHMTDSCVRTMLARRGGQAGIQNVHPHRFSRSFADKWLAAGGSTDDLMHTGWKTCDMVREYTEAHGIARAHDAHARLSPGDQI